MGLISDVWYTVVDFANYVWSNPDFCAFLVLAAIAIAASIYVVVDRLPVHSAFYLSLVFICVAVTYFFLEAEFLGVIQLLVYVGAITILFAFSIMLTRKYINEEDINDE